MAVQTRNRGGKPATKKAVPVSSKKKTQAKKKGVTAVKKPVSAVDRAKDALVRNLALAAVTVVGSGGEGDGAPDAADLLRLGEDWVGRFSHAPGRIAKLLYGGGGCRRGSSSNAYVCMQQECYYGEQVHRNGKVVMTTIAVPVLVVVVCDTVPTKQMTAVSIQLSKEETFSFGETALSWVPVEGSDSRVHFLHKSQELPSGTRPLRGHEILSLRKPDSVPSTKQVTTVDVIYEGVQHVWDASAGTATEYVELEVDANGDELSPEHQASLKGALLDAKRRLEAELVVEKAQELESYNAMVSDIALNCGSSDEDVRNSLQAMKAYKIFPSGLPQPKPSIFGNHGGFEKTNKINRFINAERYFDE